MVGDWDVALAEIHYPYAFYTVQEGENEMKILTHPVTEEYINSKGKVAPAATWVTIQITAGFYSDVRAIIDAINGAIKKATKRDNFFHIDDKTKRVFVKEEVTNRNSAIPQFALLK